MAMEKTNQLGLSDGDVIKQPVGEAGLRDLISRQEKESIVNRRANVTWDKDKNYVFVIQGKIALRAVEDKIIVLLDRFKTGYECTTCGGDGLGRPCRDCLANPGYNRFGSTCTTCNGTPNTYVGSDCPVCKGRGSSIIVPESAKALPTSGIIVSVGPKCSYRQVGERVLFGAHVGYFLPFKGNVRLRTMREYEPLADIFMLDNKSEDVLHDFLQYEEPMDNS
jgi:hypothetical protein